MPVVSLTIVSLISLIFICVGDVNFLAPIVTMPFLITYIAVDYSYFVLAMSADMNNSNTQSTGGSKSSSTATYGSMREDSESSHSSK